MKKYAALAWKEWHEDRAFLWIALGVFLGLPIIGGPEFMVQFHKPFQIWTSPWVTACGAILAVFVAVGATCRDFTGQLEDFWQSRPVTVRQWLAVKFWMGFAIVLVACIVPVAVEGLINQQTPPPEEWLLFPINLLVPYSLGFLAGCLFRRTAHAATLALAALLLLYLLPYILPPLRSLNPTSIRWWEAGIPWLLAILLFAYLTEALSATAVRRGWQLEAGRKVMFGSIALAIIILFWSATFQLGSNLPVLQTTSLKPGEQVTWIRCDGERGFLVTGRSYTTDAFRDWKTDYEARPLTLTSSGIELGDELPVDDDVAANGPWGISPLCRPDITYATDVGPDSVGKSYLCRLRVVAIGRLIPPLILWQRPLSERDERYSEQWAVSYVYGNRLYVMGSKMAILDISNPLAPKILSISPKAFNVDPWPLNELYLGNNQGRQLVIHLPNIPGLPPKQRLEAALAWACGTGETCFDGKIICEMLGQSGEYVGVARLTKLTDKAATFERVGESSTTVLQSFFGTNNFSRLQMQNGLLYMRSQAHFVGNSGTRLGAFLNPSINVFDVNGPGAPKLIGHFAAPGVTTIYPLPDGRAIVGGSQLWLVGPPPKRNN
jgi:hypothetical protein